MPFSLRMEGTVTRMGIRFLKDLVQQPISFGWGNANKLAICFPHPFCVLCMKCSDPVECTSFASGRILGQCLLFNTLLSSLKNSPSLWPDWVLLHQCCHQHGQQTAHLEPGLLSQTLMPGCIWGVLEIPLKSGKSVEIYLMFKNLARV